MSHSTPLISRLAPTPSGYLHLGNAVNFVLTWLLTRRAGGTLHLRIDDLDRARLRPAYLENIFRTLDWLGLDYDHGPTGPADFEAHYSQLLHLADYQRLLAELRHVPGLPGLLYACRCSRTDIQRNGGHHDDAACRARALLPEAPETAWRAHVPAGTTVTFRDLWQAETTVPLAAEMGDFVVRKKDGLPAYQVASVADDVRLGTTLIVRGLDLLPSSAAQLWLASQAKSAAPFRAVQFAHHALLAGADGAKLSKSTQASVRRGIMAEASSPRIVYAAVARLLGLPEAAGESLAALLREC